MITRAQGRTFASEAARQSRPQLSALDKAMLRWVVVDPEDKLLDANVGTGLMAEYLRRNMQCEVCGVSDDMESVRIARSRLRNCDIIYAAAGDIPWHEGQFDTVLYKLLSGETEVLTQCLAEAHRVLKPGGQLIVGVRSYPASIEGLMEWIAEDGTGERRRFSPKGLTLLLEGLAFEQVSWQRTSLGVGVLTAWKHKDSQADALLA